MLAGWCGCCVCPGWIEAFLYTGLRHGGDIATTEYDDWYSVSLTAGTATTKLENVATDLQGQLEIYDSAGRQVDSHIGSVGASLTATTAVTAGTYFIRAGVFFGGPGTGTGLTAPDHFTSAYHLSLTVVP